MSKSVDELAEAYVFENQANIPEWIHDEPNSVLNERNWEIESAFKAGHASRDDEVKAYLERIKIAEETVSMIDCHIRQLQNERVLSMGEMIRALKVISDSYWPSQLREALSEMRNGITPTMNKEAK